MHGTRTFPAEYGWPEADTPNAPLFGIPVPESMASPILNAVYPAIATLEAHTGGRTSVSISSLTPVRGIAGRYCLSTEHSQYFIRVSTRLENAQEEFDLLQYLTRRNAPACPLLWSGIISIPEPAPDKSTKHNEQGARYRVDIRPRIHGTHWSSHRKPHKAPQRATLSGTQCNTGMGTHYNGSLQQLEQVTTALLELHTHLADYADAPHIRQKTITRLDALHSMVDRLRSGLSRNDFSLFLEHENWARRHSKLLQRMCTEIDRTMPNATAAQCLHGEVHQGNVLFPTPAAGNHPAAALFVDFEEAMHTFLPPQWDYAYLLQRFYLSKAASHIPLAERLHLFQRLCGPVEEVAPYCRQAAWLAFAVILHIRHNHQILSSEAELNKFARLATSCHASVNKKMGTVS